jgi:hypothetical protein
MLGGTNKRYLADILPVSAELLVLQHIVGEVQHLQAGQVTQHTSSAQKYFLTQLQAGQVTQHSSSAQKYLLTQLQDIKVLKTVSICDLISKGKL